LQLHVDFFVGIFENVEKIMGNQKIRLSFVNIRFSTLTNR